MPLRKLKIEVEIDTDVPFTSVLVREAIRDALMEEAVFSGPENPTVVIHRVSVTGREAVSACEGKLHFSPPSQIQRDWDKLTADLQKRIDEVRQEKEWRDLLKRAEEGLDSFCVRVKK